MRLSDHSLHAREVVAMPTLTRLATCASAVDLTPLYLFGFFGYGVLKEAVGGVFSDFRGLIYLNADKSNGKERPTNVFERTLL